MATMEVTSGTKVDMYPVPGTRITIDPPRSAHRDRRTTRDGNCQSASHAMTRGPQRRSMTCSLSITTLRSTRPRCIGHPNLPKRRHHVQALRQAHEHLDDHFQQHTRLTGACGPREPRRSLLPGRPHHHTGGADITTGVLLRRSEALHRAWQRPTTWAELWRLVTIIICVLPTYSKYFNSMTQRLRLIQTICCEGVSEQYRYKLDE